MPSFHRHWKAGVIAATLISIPLLLKGYLTIREFPVFLALFIIGSVFPDIDAKHSRVRLWFNRIMVVCSSLIGLIWTQNQPEGQTAAFFPIFIFIGLLPDIILGNLSIHRGNFHNPFTGGIIVFLLVAIILGYYTFFSYYSAAKLSMGFYLGFLLHVALDKLFSRLKA
jgi:hypothetical protein